MECGILNVSSSWFRQCLLLGKALSDFVNARGAMNGRVVYGGNRSRWTPTQVCRSLHLGRPRWDVVGNHRPQGELLAVGVESGLREGRDGGRDGDGRGRCRRRRRGPRSSLSPAPIPSLVCSQQTPPIYGLILHLSTHLSSQLILLFRTQYSLTQTTRPALRLRVHPLELLPQSCSR